MPAEMHGVWATGKDHTPGQWVRVCETNGRVALECSSVHPAYMTSAQAKYLASKIRHLARRLEEEGG